MANRDGKGAKRRKGQKVSCCAPGERCPICHESELRRVYDRLHPVKRFRNLVQCENPRCRFTNF